MTGQVDASAPRPRSDLHGATAAPKTAVCRSCASAVPALFGETAGGRSWARTTSREFTGCHRARRGGLACRSPAWRPLPVAAPKPAHRHHSHVVDALFAVAAPNDLHGAVAAQAALAAGAEYQVASARQAVERPSPAGPVATGYRDSGIARCRSAARTGHASRSHSRRKVRDHEPAQRR